MKQAVKQVVALALVGFAAAGSPAAARARLYAIVVAQNRSLDEGVRPLQFADDDGVKTFELLGLVADRASLFVVPDAETAGLHPEAAAFTGIAAPAAIVEPAVIAVAGAIP